MGESCFRIRCAVGITIIVSQLLSSCAITHDPHEVQALKSASDYATRTSLAGQKAAWPSDRWWLQYRDPQLTALIEEGLREASDIKIAAARVDLANAAMIPAKGALMPTLSASAKAVNERQSYNYLMAREITPQGWNDAGLSTLNLNWEVDFWGKNRAALAAAKGEVEAAATEAAAARLGVSVGIAQAYAQLAALHADRKAASDAVRVRKQTVDLISDLFSKSLENEGALERVKSAEAASAAELASIDEQIALTRNQLAALIGAGPDRALSMAAPGALAGNFTGVPADLPVNLVGRRPDIVAARLRAEASIKRIDAAKAAFYPNINLAAVIGKQALGLNALTNSGSTFGSVGPAISLPIFDGGQHKAGYSGAIAQHDIAVAGYDQTLTEALHQVADTVVSKRQLNKRLLETRRSASAAEKAWNVVKNRYDGGLATYLEVLTAEDALINARRARAALQARAFTLDISMVRALGGGFRGTEQQK